MAKRSAHNDEPKRKISWAEFKKSLGIYRFVRPYSGTFAIGLIFLLGSTLTSLAFPYFTGQLVEAAEKRTFANIDQVALILGGILVFQAVFSYFRVYLFAVVTEKVAVDIRLELYRKLSLLPIPYFDRHRIGELSSRITTDVAQLQDTMSTTLAELVRQAATLIVGSAIILVLSPKLTLFMMLTFPVLVVLALVFGRYIRKLSKSRQDELAKANIVVEETMQAVKVVKAFTNELFEIRRYHRSLQEALKLSLRSAKYRSAFVAFVIFALFGGIILVLWFGVGLVQSKQLSLGDLTAFIIYTAFIGGAVGGLGELYTQVQKTVGATERILEILEEQDEPIPATQQEKVAKLNGEIAFRDVRFSYPSRPDVEVLRGMEFELRGGEKVALVGMSGAGKSTITQLLHQE